MPSAPAKKTAATKPAAKTATKPAVKSATKSATPKVVAVKAAPKPKPAEDKPAKAEVSQPTAGATLKARDLVARVAQTTGAKVKDIKSTVEATLLELGKSLDAGETLNLPPLGKLRITPAKAEGGSGPMKLKLRRGAGTASKKKQDKEALAEGGEAS